MKKPHPLGRSLIIGMSCLLATHGAAQTNRRSPPPSGSITALDARSRPTGFGTDGVPGPVVALRPISGQLHIAASGSWCRSGTSACSGPAGDASSTSTGPLPNQAYNLLGGEWRGGAAHGARFAIGTGTNVPIPDGTRGVQLFFNDDIGHYADNTGSLAVTWETIPTATPQPPRSRNPDGEWGTPQFTLTIPAPPAGQGLYLIDIQASYPDVDWNTLDRIYLEGGEYKFLRIGNLPMRSPERPLIITNTNGQVRVGGQDHYYLLVLSGGSNWILTGKHDPISLTGDAAFPGHRGNNYAETRGTYGILVDDDFRSFGTGNSGIAVGSQVPVGIVNPPTTDFEISFIEIREVGFAGMSIKTDDDTVPMNNVYIHDNYIHDIGSEGLYIGSTQPAPQHPFNGLHIENNRVLRTGTEALQIGQLGDGCKVNNNVFALAAIDWKNAFQAFQDSCSQIGIRYGRSSIHNNIFIGSANSKISFFGQERGDPHLPRDGMTIRDNYYSSFRFLGAFMGGDADGVSAYHLRRNVFRQFDFQRDEVYAGAVHPGHLIRVHAAQTNEIRLVDNVFDEPSLELVNGLGGELNGTVGNVTATGNVRAAVSPVIFHDFMGLPADVDYLLIERWTSTSAWQVERLFSTAWAITSCTKAISTCASSRGTTPPRNRQSTPPRGNSYLFRVTMFDSPRGPPMRVWGCWTPYRERAFVRADRQSGRGAHGCEPEQPAASFRPTRAVPATM